jgi:hypothetical protein
MLNIPLDELGSGDLLIGVVSLSFSPQSCFQPARPSGG